MKDWTVEQALAAQAAHTAAGGDDGDPAGPIYQWAALQRLDELQAAYEGGDSLALLDAIAQCARHELVMPEWVLREYLARYRRATHYKVKTLDEAFGSVLPKGAHLHAHRQRREKSLSAYYEVRRLHGEGMPIDETLFKRAGKPLGLSGSLTREYYYLWLPVLTSKKNAK